MILNIIWIRINVFHHVVCQDIHIRKKIAVFAVASGGVILLCAISSCVSVKLESFVQILL